VASIPLNLESVLGRVLPIFDSSFPLHFGLFSPLKSFVKNVVCPVKNKAKVKDAD